MGKSGVEKAEVALKDFATENPKSSFTLGPTFHIESHGERESEDLSPVFVESRRILTIWRYHKI